MKVLFDTSALIPALIEDHPNHPIAHACFEKIISKDGAYLLSVHSLAECFSAITNLPLTPRISPSLTRQIIEHNIYKKATLIMLSPEEYLDTIIRMADLEITGGLVYDGLILKAAEKSGAEVLLTYNKNDFLRLLPQPGLKIQSPDELV